MLKHQNIEQTCWSMYKYRLVKTLLWLYITRK